VSVELRAEIEAIPGAAELPDGWRGLLDLGETWSEDDADLWDSQWGALPLDEPLTYGCEVSRPAMKSRAVAIRLFALDKPRGRMTPGASLTLRDGGSARATGTLL
jgi:hypothetical protein